MKRLMTVAVLAIVCPLGCGSDTGPPSPVDAGVANALSDGSTFGGDVGDLGVDVPAPDESASTSSDGPASDSGAAQAPDASVLDVAPTYDSAVDACALVANKTFMATQMDECGTLANGQFVGCYWTLYFSDDGTQRVAFWHHSDLVETLTYQCDGWTLSAGKKGLTGPVYGGTYDPATAILRWEQMNYLWSSADAEIAY